MSMAVQENLQQIELSMVKRGGQMTGKLLARMMRAFLENKEGSCRGKKTIAELTQNGQNVQSMDIKDIQSFERVAKKYGVDYAVTEDNSGEQPKWKVFFKAKDIDVIQAAFKEYSDLVLGPSIHHDLKEKQDIIKNQAPDVTRNIEQGAR